MHTPRMERGNLAVFEDNESFQLLLRINLIASDHLITATASNVEEAVEVIEAIDEHLIPCDAVILDGNLCETSSECEDAKEIVQHIRARKLGVAIIGFSIEPMKSRYDVDVDYEVVKPDMSKLIATIDSL